jgi:hypothetical protein
MGACRPEAKKQTNVTQHAHIHTDTHPTHYTHTHTPTRSITCPHAHSHTARHVTNTLTQSTFTFTHSQGSTVKTPASKFKSASALSHDEVRATVTHAHSRPHAIAQTESSKFDQAVWVATLASLAKFKSPVINQYLQCFANAGLLAWWSQPLLRAFVQKCGCVAPF